MEHGVITISRQYGSGGRLIGQELAKRLGIPFYDKEIIELSAAQSGVSGDFFEAPEQAGSYLFRDFSAGNFSDLSLADKVYLAQYSAIRSLAQKGPCVIVGRAAGAALKDFNPLLNVFIYADLETRRRRAIEEYGDDPNKIDEHIAAIDKKRASYFKFYSGINSNLMTSYHLCIDSGHIGLDGAIAVIEAALHKK